MFKTLFASLLESPSNIEFDGEDSNERILYVFRRSFITNFDWLGVTAILLLAPYLVDMVLAKAQGPLLDALTPQFLFVTNAFWYLFVFGYIFQNFLNWFFNVYIISSKRIIDIDFVGIIHKNISETVLENVEDVTSKVSGTLRVVFNYGTVHIQTAGERREFEFTDVANPAKVRDIISDIIAQLGGHH